LRILRRLGDGEKARGLQEPIYQQIGYNALKSSRLKMPRTCGMLAGFCITEKGIKPHVLSHDVCLEVRAEPTDSTLQEVPLAVSAVRSGDKGGED
jgi:hypothetical protein